MHRIDIETTAHSQMLAVTDKVQGAIDASGVREGVCHIYVPHTTAAVTINENADPTVVGDVLHAVDALVPWNDPAYRHAEGNSAAHVKAIFFGTSETLIVSGGRLLLGTWQGVFFCEFDGPRDERRVVVTVVGA